MRWKMKLGTGRLREVFYSSDEMLFLVFLVWVIMLIGLIGCVFAVHFFKNASPVHSKVPQDAPNHSREMLRQSIEDTISQIPEEAGFYTYHVRDKNTVFLISKNCNIPEKTILKLNGLKKDENGSVLIQRGRELILPYNQNPYQATVSWYGATFHNRTMSNGQKFNMYDGGLVAHKCLPLGTRVLFFNPVNKAFAIAVVTDRGPYAEGREFDLSRQLAKKLGIKNRGVSNLTVIVDIPSKYLVQNPISRL